MTFGKVKAIAQEMIDQTKGFENWDEASYVIKRSAFHQPRNGVNTVALIKYSALGCTTVVAVTEGWTKENVQEVFATIYDDQLCQPNP